VLSGVTRPASLPLPASPTARVHGSPPAALPRLGLVVRSKLGANAQLPLARAPAAVRSWRGGVPVGGAALG